jgi:hypothetical protein
VSEEIWNTYVREGRSLSGEDAVAEGIRGSMTGPARAGAS